MKSALSSMTSERERLKQYLDTTSPQVAGLKNELAAVGKNTLTQTLSHRKLPDICQGFYFASDCHSSPMPFPPTPRTRGDTSASLAQGCLAALIPAYLFPLQSCACFSANNWNIYMNNILILLYFSALSSGFLSLCDHANVNFPHIEIGGVTPFIICISALNSHQTGCCFSGCSREFWAESSSAQDSLWLSDRWGRRSKRLPSCAGGLLHFTLMTVIITIIHFIFILPHL